MKVITTVKRIATFIFMLMVGGCVRIPGGMEPVTNFDVNRYLGTWYEIARLDHSFERGLTRVTAEYTLGEKGLIKVLNRGYDPVKKEWKEAKGRAYFVDATDVGRLKVSFFGPFFGGYNILDLDRENYSYALVCGPNLNYLWILSRSPELDRNTVDTLVTKAGRLGFATDELIFVSHAETVK
jgi:apolipoprotein D and lipocalin family protein